MTACHRRGKSYLLAEDYSRKSSQYSTSAVAEDGRIFSAPHDADYVMVIDPLRNTSYLLAERYYYWDLYTTSAVAQDGRIFAAPFDANHVLVIDPSQNKSYLLAEDYSSYGGSKYNGKRYVTSAVAQDGRIFAAPYRASHILVIDPSRNESYLLATNYTSYGMKYADSYGRISLFWTSAVAQDGRIFAAPFTAEHVLVIDPSQNKSYLAHQLIRGKYESSYYLQRRYKTSVVAQDGRIFAVPYSARDILVIDPLRNESYKLMDPGISSWPAFETSAVAQDGRIFAVPYSQSYVLVVDPARNETYLLKGERYRRYRTSIVAQDGRIFAVPSSANHILVIEPSRNKTYLLAEDYSFGTSYYTTGYHTSAIAQDGRIFAAPYSADNVLVIDLSLCASTFSPTQSPSASPTTAPTTTFTPTATPTESPTMVPTATFSPSTTPTQSPTMSPSASPTTAPITVSPTMSAPFPMVAQLGDSGTSIHIIFSRSTDTPDLPCMLVFTLETHALLGDSPTCLWVKDDQLNVTLGQGYRINPNDNMTFYDDVISDSDYGMSLSSTTVALQAPLNTVEPVAIARGPGSLGVCGSEFLSASESHGNAGRPLSFKWIYLGRFDSNDTLYPNSTQSRTLSLLAATVTTPSLELNSSRFGAGVHRYMVVVSNWLGKAGNTTVEFTKVLGQAPRIQLSTPRVITVKPGSPVKLHPQAFPAVCTNTTQQFHVQVHWLQIFGDSAHLDSQTRPHAQNFSQSAISISKPDLLDLTIPAKNLLMGETFGFLLRARTLGVAGNIIGEIYSPFVIKVNTIPVTAIITGGSTRDISVLQTEALVFNALDSTDPASLNSTSLIFTWSLFHPNGTTTHLLPLSYGKLSLQPSSLAPGARYEVTVTVTGVRSRVATATQVILTKAVVIPTVELNFGVGNGQTKANPEEKLSLVASALNVTKWEWTCLTNNFDLETAVWSGGVLSGLESPNLIFAPGSLNAGFEYHFRVTATGIGGGKGSSELKFHVNQPPLLGSCSVSPAVGGIALNTDYRFECAGWNDDPGDFPLEYKFQSAPDKWNFIDLCLYRELSYYTTILSQPEGSANLGGNLTLRALVRDSLGAKTMVKMQAEVLESNSSLETVEIQLQDASSIGDFQTASVLIEGIIRQSEKTADANSRRSAFSAAFDVLDASRNSSVDSKIDPESFISQVKSLTSAEAKPESEGGGGGLTTSSALLALSMVEDLPNIETDQIELSETTVKKGLEILIDVLSSSPSEGSEAAMSDSERQSVSERVERNLRAIAQRQTANSVVGEPAYSVGTDDIQIVSQLKAPDDVAGIEFYTYDDSSTVIISPSISFNETDDQTPVQVIFTSIESKSNMYQTTAKSTPVTTVELYRNNTVYKVNNTLAPFELFLASKELSFGETYECQFWDVETNRWSSRGMKTVGFDSEYVACESTHLTTFSAQVVKDESVEVNINTFGKDDIKGEAFSLNNPVMLLCTSIVAVFIVLVVGFSFVDRRFAKGGEAGAHDFWRENNYMKNMRSDILSGQHERNCGDFGDSLYWGLRRKHIWTSICFRHKADFLTSTKRLVVLITVIFNTMAVCLLLLDTEQSVPFLGSDFSVAVVAMLLAYPVPLAVYYFFQRPAPIQWYLKTETNAGFAWLAWVLWIVGIMCSGSMDEMETDFGGDDDGDENGDVDDDDGEEGDAEKKGEDSDSEGDEAVRPRKTNDVVMAIGATFGGWLGTEVKLRKPVIEEKKNSPKIKTQQSRTKISIPKLRSASKTDRLGAVVRQIDSAPRERKILGSVYKDCRDFDVSNHEISYNDVIGLVFACIVILGCWFIIAVLSFKMRDRLSDWVVSNVLSFSQDIFIRFLVLVIYELAVFVPCCCCCGWCESKPKRVLKLKAEVYATLFTSGNIGIYYRNLKVVHVEKDSQADKLGIRKGLRIASIGSELVHTDAQAARKLHIVHRTEEKFYLGFELENARENKGKPPMYRYRGHTFPLAYPFSVETDKQLASLPGGVQFINRRNLHPAVLAIMKANPYDASYDELDSSSSDEDFFDALEYM